MSFYATYLRRGAKIEKKWGLNASFFSLRKNTAYP